MTDRQVVSFDRFQLGDYGRLGEVQAPPGSYAGRNVQTYVDGSVGPRSGLVDLAPTGVPVGEVYAFGHEESLGKVWAIIGTAVYQFNDDVLGDVIEHCVGILGITPTERVLSDQSNGFTYFTLYGDTTYSINHASGIVLSLVGAPGGRTISVYGERLVVGGQPTNGHRVLYSAPGDFNSWPVTNYFDVGNGYEILLLVVQRQYLAIAKHDGSLWVLSGVPGVSDYLRHVVRALPLGKSTRWGITADGTIWMTPEAAICPATFNGSVLRSVEGVGVSDLEEPIVDNGVIPVIGNTGLEKPTDTLFVAGRTGNTYVDGQARLFRSGRWSRHKFGVSVSGYVDGAIGPTAFLCDGGAVGSAAKFYAWSYQLDRPPISGNTFESLGDASSTPPDCEFFLPEWWAHDEHEVRVRAVIVDFKKWGHGFAHDNTFTVEITPLRRFTSGADADPLTMTFDEAESEADAAGERDRVRQNFAGPYANGFIVGVTGIVGCAIQKIHVVLDRRPMQGVA